MRALLSVAVTILILATASCACADEGALMIVRGTIVAMEEHPSVVMERMDVRIDVHPPGAGFVNCSFVLRNVGPATTVHMGFPERGATAADRAAYRDFTTWVDGRIRPTQIRGYHRRGKWWRQWRVMPVHFAAGQRRRVRVRYQEPMRRDRDRRFLLYDIGTGASWKGPIGFARVRVVGHSDPTRDWLTAEPSFHQTSATSFEWVRRSVEPQDYVAVTLSRGYLGTTVAGSPVAVPYGPPNQAGTPPYPRLEGGTVWVQARLLAQWLRAELRAEPSQATFIKGSRVAAVRPGAEWLLQNGVRS
jgi:hypothetical protein